MAKRPFMISRTFGVLTFKTQDLARNLAWQILLHNMSDGFLWQSNVPESIYFKTEKDFRKAVEIFESYSANIKKLSFKKLIFAEMK